MSNISYSSAVITPRNDALLKAVVTLIKCTVKGEEAHLPAFDWK
jgi:hypothetical protein